MAERLEELRAGAHEEIIFNAGTHHDAIRMKYADFARLAKPIVCAFASKN